MSYASRLSALAMNPRPMRPQSAAPGMAGSAGPGPVPGGAEQILHMMNALHQAQPPAAPDVANRVTGLMPGPKPMPAVDRISGLMPAPKPVFDRNAWLQQNSPGFNPGFAPAPAPIAQRIQGLISQAKTMPQIDPVLMALMSPSGH